MTDESATVPPPSVDEVKGWVGFRLDEIAGAGVGKIEGVFVDDSSGEQIWLLARMGRFGPHTLVPGRDAVQGVGRVWVPYTRDHIRRAPKVEPSVALTAEAERQLLEHYRIDPEAGGAAEIADRDAADISAKPI
jgi:hypothetical protein